MTGAFAEAPRDKNAERAMVFKVSKGFFGQTRALTKYIDEFHNLICEAGMLFRKMIRVYLDCGCSEDFLSIVERLSNVENQADELRRRIEARLYEHDLIPDMRADVMDVIEHMDDLLNYFESNGYRLSTERPEFIAESRRDLEELVETVITCSDKAVDASRAFFRDAENVRDHVHKVLYQETEADRLSSKIKRVAFASDLSLAEKMHIRYFIDHIDEIANVAEDVADKLSITFMKRSI